MLERKLASSNKRVSTRISQAVYFAYTHYYGREFDRPESSLHASNRIVHGIMHASACMELIPEIDQFYRKYIGPKYNLALESIAQQFQLTLQELLELIQIAALFHDSGRKGDGVDLWDEISAENLYNYLKNECGLPEVLACIFKLSLEYKDKPDQFKQHSKIEVPELFEDTSDAPDYLRQLIQVADTLEITRDRSTFYCRYLPESLQNLLCANEAKDCLDDFSNLVLKAAQRAQDEYRATSHTKNKLILDFENGSIRSLTINKKKISSAKHDEMFMRWYKSIFPLDFSIIETIHKKLLNLIHTYLTKYNLDPHKKIIFKQLQSVLKPYKDKDCQSKYQSILNFKTQLEKLDKKIIGIHRTPDWQRFVFNALSFIVLPVALIRSGISYAQYGTLRFWKPDSEKAVHYAEEELAKIDTIHPRN